MKTKVLRSCSRPSSSKQWSLWGLKTIPHMCAQGQPRDLPAHVLKMTASRKQNVVQNYTPHILLLLQLDPER